MNATKKPSKLDTLNADLVKAEAALAEAHARLDPQIEAEQTKVAALRKAYEKLDKTTSTLYRTLTETRDIVSKELDPQRAVIRASITEKLAGQFPNADIARLVVEEMGRQVAAHPSVALADKVFHDTYKAKDKAYGNWNVANSPGGPLAKLERELDRFQDVVTWLKAEIERLPRYREAAKARRDEAKAEEKRDADTVAARDFLKAQEKAEAIQAFDNLVAVAKVTGLTLGEE